METSAIRAAVQQQFRFLTQKWGFGEPRILEHNMYAVLEYRDGTVGIDIEVEYFGFHVFVLAVNLKNGTEPEGYYSSEEGICRQHLETILSRFKLVPNEEIARIRELERQMAVETNRQELQLIQGMANLLQRSIGFILEHKNDVFLG